MDGRSIPFPQFFQRAELEARLFLCARRAERPPLALMPVFLDQRGGFVRLGRFADGRKTDSAGRVTPRDF